MNKRGQGLSTTAIILIVLGVVILVVLIIGFTIGWSKIAPWVSTSDSNIDAISQQCEVACSSKSNYEYCEVVKDIKGLSKESISALKEPFLESSNLDEELNYEENTAKLSCNTFSNLGYFSCDIDCSYLKKQELEAISNWNPPIEQKEISGEELISKIENFEKTSSTTILNAVSSYSGNYFSYKEKFHSELNKKLKEATASNPLIIVLGDIHGTPEVQDEIIDDLRDNFNINFVGVEGWAGSEVDKQRGYDILNAEDFLILRILVANQGYEVVPLEDAKIQEIALKSMLFQYFLISKQSLEYINKKLGKEVAFEFIADPYILKEPNNKNSADFKNWEILIRLRKAHLKFNYNTKSLARKLHVWTKDFYSDEDNSESNQIFSELNDYFGEEEVMKCFSGRGMLDERNCPTYKENLDCNLKKINPHYLITTKRSCIMVDKMDEAMKQNNKKVGVLVAGQAHCPQIISLLRQKGYNIVYIDAEPEEE